MPVVKRLLPACLLFVPLACSPPPPPTPSLTPMEARELLNANGKAKDWLTYVKKQDASCEYSVDLPDQSSHPLSIDVQHAVMCGGRPAPRALDATVSFEYDKAAGQWAITRFSS